MKNIDFLKRNLVPFIVLCSLLSSCTSKKKEKESFDYPLLQKNEALSLAGNYEKALELNREYLHLAQKNGYTDGAALCYINIANLSIIVGNYEKGLVFLKKAESLLNKSDNEALKARVFQEYGQMSKVARLHKTALEYNAKALYHTRKCSVEDQKKYILTKVFSNRADFLYEAKQSDSALIYFHKAMNIENTDLINSLIAKHHMFYTKQIDSVNFYLERALILANQRKEILDSRRGQVYRIAGDYYRTREKDAFALTYYQKGLDIYIKTRKVYNIPFIYEAMADTYGYLGDKEKQAEFNNKFTHAKEQLSKNQNNTVNLLIDKLLTEKEVSAQTFKFNVIIFSGLVLLLIILAGFLLYKRLKHSKKQIINETADLKNSITLLQSENENLSHKIIENNNELILLAKNNDSSFLTRFQEIHPDFIETLLKRNSDLSSTDLWLSAMISLNFSSKQIAAIMSIEHKSAQQKKYRLRKKLNIPSEEDFFVYFQKLENNESTE
ncbi:hypothetical protein QWZ06_07585 [Chryseobacterium tructae]|uniref:Tetratricopeptide repeat protein n=1 Tax=Chryseobacterium tructae TaxID=1037380 RepID=A0ABV7XV47_9FLAO|nr:hypothetical protein [Chryseobacterium tructae]MDN3692131.1 hypothetical protein [Chryseobacterium tructae]